MSDNNYKTTDPFTLIERESYPPFSNYPIIVTVVNNNRTQVLRYPREQPGKYCSLKFCVLFPTRGSKAGYVSTECIQLARSRYHHYPASDRRVTVPPPY